MFVPAATRLLRVININPLHFTLQCFEVQKRKTIKEQRELHFTNLTQCNAQNALYFCCCSYWISFSPFLFLVFFFLLTNYKLYCISNANVTQTILLLSLCLSFVEWSCSWMYKCCMFRKFTRVLNLLWDLYVFYCE